MFFPGFEIAECFVPLENHEYVDVVKLDLRGSCICTSNAPPMSALCVTELTYITVRLFIRNGTGFGNHFLGSGAEGACDCYGF